MLKSILLCTYNESESILEALSDIKKNIPDSEIIIVDDNSTDGTIEKIKNSKNYNKIKLIIRRKNKGLASAFLRAILEAKGEYIGWIDTNMTYLTKQFSLMESKLKNENKDIVILSRYVDGGGDEREFIRSFASKCLNKFCKFFYKSKINDFSSSIFLMNRKILDEVPIIGYGHGDFFIEFLYNVERNKFHISEIPYIQKKDVLPIMSKSAPNLIKFGLFGIQYFFRIITTVLRNN